MATDLNKPVVGDGYAALIPALQQALVDAAKMWEPTDTGGTTNTPTNARRWNAATSQFERYNGTSWVANSTSYNMNISGTAAALAGGVAGAINYQVGVGSSGFSAAGTAGQVLVSGGAGAPTWTASPSFSTPALGTPASGNLANCTFPTLNQNTTGSAGTAGTAGSANALNASNNYSVTNLSASGALSGGFLNATNTSADSQVNISSVGPRIGLSNNATWGSRTVAARLVMATATGQYGLANPGDTWLFSEGQNGGTSGNLILGAGLLQTMTFTPTGVVYLASTPAANDNSTKLATTAYVDAAAASVLGSATAGNYLSHPSFPDFNGVQGTLALIKTVHIRRAGTYRTYIKVGGQAGNVTEGRVYKNGSAFGTDHQFNATATNYYAEDLAFAAGDTCELWGAAYGGSAFTLIANLMVLEANPVTPGNLYSQMNF